MVQFFCITLRAPIPSTRDAHLRKFPASRHRGIDASSRRPPHPTPHPDSGLEAATGTVRMLVRVLLYGVVYGFSYPFE